MPSTDDLLKIKRDFKQIIKILCVLLLCIYNIRIINNGSSSATIVDCLILVIWLIYLVSFKKNSNTVKNYYQLYTHFTVC